jgi:hypothetical protein
MKRKIHFYGVSNAKNKRIRYGIIWILKEPLLENLKEDGKGDLGKI